MNPSIVVSLGLSVYLGLGLWIASAPRAAAEVLATGSCPENPFVVTVFSPDAVADPVALDDIVGLQGFAIERFEDVELVPGLTYLNPVTGVELATLPNLFNRDTFFGSQAWLDDPWDGDHVLSNYTDNVAGTSASIGPLQLRFSGGAESVGFGLSNLQNFGASFRINGITQTVPNSLPNFTPGAGHNAYIRIDRMRGCEPIFAFELGTGVTDSITLDHVAYDLAVIDESFVDLADQLDTVGVFDPDSKLTVFTAVDSIGEPVATVSGARASFVGANSEAETRFLRLGTSPGLPDDEGVLLVADLPGFFPGEETLVERTIRITSREVSGGMALRSAFGSDEGVCIRPRLTDVSGEQAESIACRALSADFEESSFLVRSQTVRNIGGAITVDLSRIIGLALVIETLGSPQASVSATEVQIDSIVRVPAPPSGALGTCALLTLGMLVVCRRRTDRPE